MLSLVAALGVASIFAVYTFIGLFVTEGVHLGERWIPVALGLFGLGMTGGNLLGGWIADRHPEQGLAAGFGSVRRAPTHTPLLVSVLIAKASDGTVVNAS